MYIVGIDIGGTFTDGFASSLDGRAISAKSPSTPPDYGEGVIAVLTELADQCGASLESFLAETRYICHGTTATLNALVTGALPKVGLLTTAGHGDSIFIMNVEGRYAGRGPDYVQSIPRAQKPSPILDRHLIKEIDERIDYKGAQVVALNEDQVLASIDELAREGVKGIAVSLLWSFANPSHEHRVRDLINASGHGFEVAISSEISPRIGEYSRAVTTVVNCQVAQILRGYLNGLEKTLQTLGFSGELLIMQGSGGAVSAEEAVKFAITTVGAVLAGGVAGATRMGALLGHRDIIMTDMGGTTFLTGLVVDAKPIRRATTLVNQYPLNAHTVNVEAIGSGGGAIASVQGHGIRVGPQSAQARPGPACYAAGGLEPTVTDADLVLGLLDPDFFLGGRRRLDRAAAIRAIEERISKPLGIGVEEAAAAIFGIANAQAADLIRRVVVNSGYDPRQFVLYAFGGAGPVHCVGYAEDLGVGEVVVPLGETAATFSAYGLSTASIVISAELSRPHMLPVAFDEVARAFAELESQLRARLERQHVEFMAPSFVREVDVRYAMQLGEVATPLPAGELSPSVTAKIGDWFEELYTQLYGPETGFRDAGMQVVTYRMYAIGELGSPPLPKRAGRVGAERLRPTSRRRAFLGERAGWGVVDIYRSSQLGPGDAIEGPSIVEAVSTTLVIPEGKSAVVDDWGNVRLSGFAV